MAKPDKVKRRPPPNANHPRGPGRPEAHRQTRDGFTPTAGIEHSDKLAKICGIKAVTALFRRDPQRVVRLYFDEKMKLQVGDFCSHMARMQRPYRLVDDSELQKISGTVLHGGVVAAALPRTVPEFDIRLAPAWAGSRQPLLILDGVGNPNNLGAIARTMAYFGLRFLLISDHPAQAGLSDSAHRVAEGGLEYLDIFRVNNVPRTCRQLREYFQVVGTALSGRAAQLADLSRDSRPCALVLGNEEQGLSAETLAACESSVRIHGSGQVQSLNVSATAAILIHQLLENRPPAYNAGGRTADSGQKKRTTPTRKRTRTGAGASRNA